MITTDWTMSQDTQVVLLLTGRFSKSERAHPLSLAEYNSLAGWLRQSSLRPADLLKQPETIDWMAAKLDRDRTLSLLERGAALALAVDQWANSGIWIISRGDELYPSRLREHLGRNAPALLYGAGNASLLDRGGLAIVGSRDVDQEGERFTESVAMACAEQRVPVVSGGARGVDQIAIAGAVNAGGTAVAILPQGLAKDAVASKYREGMRDDRLVLVSPFSPDAGFSVGNAMGRNKLIYAMADAALVVSTSLRTGGTWAGAEEELRRTVARAVYVRVDGTEPEGNRALLRIGARQFPAAPWDLESLAAGSDEVQVSIANAPVLTATKELPPVASVSRDAPSVTHEHHEAPAPSAPVTIYDAVLPVLTGALEKAKEPKPLAEELDLQPGQLKVWLERAVAEGHLVKKKKPVRYVRAVRRVNQTSLGFGGKD